MKKDTKKGNQGKANAQKSSKKPVKQTGSSAKPNPIVPPVPGKPITGQAALNALNGLAQILNKGSIKVNGDALTGEQFSAISQNIGLLSTYISNNEQALAELKAKLKEYEPEVVQELSEEAKKDKKIEELEAKLAKLQEPEQENEAAEENAKEKADEDEKVRQLKTG